MDSVKMPRPIDPPQVVSERSVLERIDALERKLEAVITLLDLSVEELKLWRDSDA